MADEVLDEANFKAKIREIDPTVRYLYVPGARDTEIWLQEFPQHLRECYIDKKSLFAVRDYFISLDNAYRAVREASKSKQEPKQDKTKKSGRYGFSAPRAPTIAITGDTTVVKPKAKAACYVCGSTDGFR